MTFGEYRILLEDPERWSRSGLPLDRVTVVNLLERLRRIRNDVMHFDPDGIPPEDLEALRDGARFFRSLQTIGIA
jgi:hypothetical protein